MWFDGCETVQEVKERYRLLCMRYHPDRGGDTRTMQDINAAFTVAFEHTKKRQNDAHNAQKESGFKYSEETRSQYVPYCREAPEEFRAMITELIRLGVDVELCGVWVWVSGDTRPAKEALKKLGFRWHAKKKMWYYRPFWAASEKNSNVPMENIRAAYGSQKYRRDDEGLVRI